MSCILKSDILKTYMAVDCLKARCFNRTHGNIIFFFKVKIKTDTKDLFLTYTHISSKKEKKINLRAMWCKV